MSDYGRDAAMRRMELRTPEESRMSSEGQQNAGGHMHLDADGRPYYDEAPRSEYPRMLYRQTDVPQYQEWADSLHAGSEEKMVINKFDGLLCDTTIAADADTAEALAVEGWDITPQAAHGLSSGLAEAVSAKDQRIAELERQLAEREPDTLHKRGPGRPRNPENASLTADAT